MIAEYHVLLFSNISDMCAAPVPENGASFGVTDAVDNGGEGSGQKPLAEGPGAARAPLPTTQCLRPPRHSMCVCSLLTILVMIYSIVKRMLILNNQYDRIFTSVHHSPNWYN